MLTVEAFAFVCVGEADEHKDYVLALCHFHCFLDEFFFVAVALQ